jgi:hypothetical protein
MKVLRFLPILLLLSAPLQARTLPGKLHLLNQVILPEVNLNRATIEEAIEILREASREVDPDGGGINVVIPPDAKDIARPITLSLRNISGPDLYRLIVDMSGLRSQIRGNLIWLVPPE